MATVWVIEQGSYSDYHIVGVFSSRENAELVVKAITQPDEQGDVFGETPTIAEWEMDPAVHGLRRGWVMWRVVMLRDGAVELCERFHPSYSINNKTFIWRRSTAPAYRGRNVPDALDATMWAKTDKQAIKAANERRARLIASGEWT